MPDEDWHRIKWKVRNEGLRTRKLLQRKGIYQFENVVLLIRHVSIYLYFFIIIESELYIYIYIYIYKYIYV